MMAERTDHEERAHSKRKSSFDWTSALAFVGATVLGLASVVNYIHQTFKNKFIMNSHGGEWTPYAPAYREYWSDKKNSEAKVARGEPLPFVGKLRESSRQHELQYEAMEKLVRKGTEKPEKLHEINRSFMKEKRKLSAEFAEKCDEIGLKAFGIPYENKIAKWTIGTVKKAQELGKEVRSEALIRFGTVTIVGIGAVAVLKHSRNVLDRIEDKLASYQDDRGR